MEMPTLTLTDDPPAAAERAIEDGLNRFNERHTGIVHARPLTVLIELPGEAGAAHRVAGGLIGRTSLGLLFVDLLFVPDELRGRGLGAQMMHLAEDEAVRRGCTQATVMTIVFQAPEFYRRLGYVEFGRTDAADPTHARVFLKKDLKAETSPGRS